MDNHRNQNKSETSQYMRIQYLSHMRQNLQQTPNVSSKARGLNFGPSLHLHPYFVYESSEGYGKPAPEPSWLDNAIITKISWAGSNINH